MFCLQLETFPTRLRFLLLGEILDGLHRKYQFPRTGTLGSWVHIYSY